MSAASTTTVTSLESKFIIDFNRKVGSGFSAEVYFVLSRKSYKAYALKLFYLEHEAEYRQELQAYKTLRSVAGTVKVVRSGVDSSSGRSYILMDLPGISLHEVTDRMFKDPSAGRSAIGELFKAIVPGLIMVLKDFHEHGILHRDVKPSNILIIPRDESSAKVFLIDLGDATHIDGDEGQIVEDRERCGTPVFRSIHAHYTNDLSYRDDIESLAYALISVLWWPKPLPWNIRHLFVSNDVINDRMAEEKCTADLFKLCKGHLAVLELPALWAGTTSQLTSTSQIFSLIMNTCHPLGKPVQSRGWNLWVEHPR